MENGVGDEERRCRACGADAEALVSIFEVGDGDGGGGCARIDEMLMACATVVVETDDALPKFVCGGCEGRLRAAYDFRLQCESVDRSLRGASKSSPEGGEGDTIMIVKKEAAAAAEIYNDLSRMLLVSEQEKEGREKSPSNIKQEPGLSFADHLKCDFIEFLENNQLLLTCRECSKAFSTLEGLRCHKRLHTGRLFVCKVCNKEYTRQNHLQRHELSHGRRTVHVCKICGKTLTRQEYLKRHLAIHLKDKPYTCEGCGRGFTRLEHADNHRDKCKGEPVHVCDVCNKNFIHPDSLAVHRRMHENKTPVLPTADTLDNIAEHYYEIEDSDAAMAVFQDDGDDDDDNDDDENDNGEEPRVGAAPDSGQRTRESEGGDADFEGKREKDDDIPVHKVEIVDDENIGDDGGVDDHDYDYLNDVAENDSDTEYFPTAAAARPKRGRGRPRKHAGRRGGRPRGRPRIIKRERRPDGGDDDIEGEFSCEHCGRIFIRMSTLERHKRAAHDVKVYACRTCDKIFSRANHLKRHMLSHSEKKPYTCEKCEKCFARSDHLAQHLKLHVKLEESECEVCHRVFVRADHMAKHKAAKHNIGDKIVSEKKYKCPVCLKGFTTEKYRDVHMKGHTGEKKHQCKICQKSFLSKSHLTEHVKFHNDNSKKFLCSECGQRFIRNDYLVIHMRRHRGEKPFKCKFCGKGFPRTTDLTVHERYHTGEKTHLCTICGRGFGRAYNLTVHMRTHTGEKPYKCSYCDAAFAQGNDLKAHIRRHTGERFQCDLCTETFLMGYLLTQHKRTVHGLNVVSNIRRLQPVVTKMNNEMNDDDPDSDQQQYQEPPITIPLPVPVIPANILCMEMPDVKTIIE